MVKGDKFFDAAVHQVADKLKSDGKFEIQISSLNGRYGITIFNDHYDAGLGTMVEASNLALETLRAIEKIYCKPLAMKKTQSDVSLESLTGVMSIAITED